MLKQELPQSVVLKLNLQGNVGWPDRLVLLPNGWSVFIEFKRRGKKPTPKQEYVHRQLRDLGHAVGVYDDAEAALSFVRGCCFGAARIST